MFIELYTAEYAGNRKISVLASAVESIEDLSGGRSRIQCGRSTYEVSSSREAVLRMIGAAMSRQRSVETKQLHEYSAQELSDALAPKIRPGFRAMDAPQQ